MGLHGRVLDYKNKRMYWVNIVSLLASPSERIPIGNKLAGSARDTLLAFFHKKKKLKIKKNKKKSRRAADHVAMSGRYEFTKRRKERMEKKSLSLRALS